MENETMKILEIIKSASKIHMDDILKKTNLSLGETLIQLQQMELCGLIQRLPGGNYKIKD